MTYGCQGSGNQMAAPLLDNQFIGHNQLVKKVTQLPASETEASAKDIINSIAERDIYTGDNVDILMITKDGITEKREKVRRD